MITLQQTNEALRDHHDLECNYDDNYYADQYCRRTGPDQVNGAEKITTADLALFMKPGCPYCDRTIRAIDELGLNIGRKDITSDVDARRELATEGGMIQVPCLRIEGRSGKVDWLYESLDIIRYLTELNR